MHGQKTIMNIILLYRRGIFHTELNEDIHGSQNARCTVLHT